MRLSVPGEVVLSCESSPLVRTPLHAAEELMRFRGLVGLSMYFQILRSDEASTAVYADAIFGAMPASMVAASVSLLFFMETALGPSNGTYSRSDFEAKVLLQFSQANVATDLVREREALRLLGVGVVGGAKLPKLVRSSTL